MAVMGSTMDGSYEPVAEISASLDRLQDETGPDIPVHVDGASGGFVAPFLHPGLEWDFRVPRVQSINAYGHVAVMRIVVRNGFSRDLAGLLLDDIRRQADALAAHPGHAVPLVPEEARQPFSH